MPKKESSAKKSIRHKYRFLLNANISRKIIPPLLVNASHDFKHISEISDESLSDPEIIAIAKKEKRIIITHDLDYGEIYYLKEQGNLGVIMFRLTNQSSENVSACLSEFFNNPKYNRYNFYNSLVIISDEKIRIFSPE